MRRVVFTIGVIIMLAACQAAVDVMPEDIAPELVAPETINVRVYNSAWEIVEEASVAESRALDSDALIQAYVVEYNNSHTDDQLHIVYGEDAVPVEEAPACNAWIVTYDTHDIIGEYLNWPRSDLVERRELWRQQAYADGGILFVDRIPPPPEPVIVDPYIKYSLYYIDVASGTILEEEHCEAWEAEGYESQEAYYNTLRPLWAGQVYADGGTTRLVSGELYTP